MNPSRRTTLLLLTSGWLAACAPGVGSERSAQTETTAVAATAFALGEGGYDIAESLAAGEVLGPLRSMGNGYFVAYDDADGRRLLNGAEFFAPGFGAERRAADYTAVFAQEVARWGVDAGRIIIRHHPDSAGGYHNFTIEDDAGEVVARSATRAYRNHEAPAETPAELLADLASFHRSLVGLVRANARAAYEEGEASYWLTIEAGADGMQFVAYSGTAKSAEAVYRSEPFADADLAAAALDERYRDAVQLEAHARDAFEARLASERFFFLR